MKFPWVDSLMNELIVHHFPPGCGSLLDKQAFAVKGVTGSPGVLFPRLTLLSAELWSLKCL